MSDQQTNRSNLSLPETVKAQLRESLESINNLNYARNRHAPNAFIFELNEHDKSVKLLCSGQDYDTNIKHYLEKYLPPGHKVRLSLRSRPFCSRCDVLYHSESGLFEFDDVLKCICQIGHGVSSVCGAAQAILTIPLFASGVAALGPPLFYISIAASVITVVFLTARVVNKIMREEPLSSEELIELTLEAILTLSGTTSHQYSSTFSRLLGLTYLIKAFKFVVRTCEKLINKAKLFFKACFEKIKSFFCGCGERDPAYTPFY